MTPTTKNSKAPANPINTAPEAVRHRIGSPLLLLLLVIPLVSTVAGADQTSANATSTINYYGGGVAAAAGLGQYDEMYYWMSQQAFQNASQLMCFSGSVLPPEQSEELCPSGALYSIGECRDKCTAIGYGSTDDFAMCPYNLAGCCDCPYLSFKFDPQYALSGVYNFDLATPQNQNPNPAWTGVGWFVLAMYSLLLCVLAYLIFVKLCAGRSHQSGGKQDSSRSPFAARAQIVAIQSSRVLAVGCMVAFAAWVIVYLVAMNGLGYQNYFAWTQSQVGVILHVLGGAIWLVSAAMQFVGPVRRRWPRVHRAFGWTCAVFCVVSTIGLLVLVLGPHLSSVAGTILAFIFASYWLFTLGISIRYATQKDIDSHRRWITRHVFLGSAVILQVSFTS